MPFDKLFRQERAEEEAAADLYILELRERIVELREELEVYDTDAWAKVDAILAEKLGHAMTAMMVGDPEQMILARERARVVSDLRAEPQKLRERIAELVDQVRQVEGVE